MCYPNAVLISEAVTTNLSPKMLMYRSGRRKREMQLCMPYGILGRFNGMQTILILCAGQVLLSAEAKDSFEKLVF